MAKRGPHGVSTEYAAIAFNIIYIQSVRDMVSLLFMGSCYGGFRRKVNQ